MNKDFIKWMVGYAEGFELKFTGTINHELVEYRNRSQMITCDWHKIETWILYPLLLQRAIEGINKGKGLLEIIACNTDIQIFNRETVGFTYIMLNEYRSIDQAKEEALKYIYKQETI